MLSTQNAAWNRGDVDAFMIGYWENDSLMFVGSSGITYGYKNTLANYKKRYPGAEAMGKLTFDLIEVKRLSSEYYHVTGKWHLQRSIGDVGGHFTLIFRNHLNAILQGFYKSHLILNRLIGRSNHQYWVKIFYPII